MKADAYPRSRARGISFTARDVATAVEEIRGKLGPDAVILDIRRHASRGLSRLWQAPGVEIIACLPDAEEAASGHGLRPEAEPAPRPAPPAVPAGTPKTVPAPVPSVASAATPPAPLLPGRAALERYSRSAGVTADAPDARIPGMPGQLGAGDIAEFSSRIGAAPVEEPPAPSGSWRCAPVLERLGLLPLHLERVFERMSALQESGHPRPTSLAQELALAREALRRSWRYRPTLRGGPAPLHVFIGPPGSGKSTVLCKWLAQTVLVEGRAAGVWRLDGRTANASERVSIYADILGVPVERTWTGDRDPAVAGFVDLPGTESNDPEALAELASAIRSIPGAQVHLVLNAAYATPLLLGQARAFGVVPVTDLVMTHLDEETSWSKLWNLVLGTDYPLGYLSAGQNVPGRFRMARPELLGASLFGVE